MWIHGGGNDVGFPHEPEHDGDGLASRGVIYVSVTYRLNIFGFFAHPELTAESEYGASGNYGNLDHLAALKWLRENIAAFGGDPDNITIFGQSAGAGDVHTLAVNPLAKGLFNRAISMSGSGAASLMRTARLEDLEELGLKFQQAAGCSSLVGAPRGSGRLPLQALGGAALLVWHLRRTTIFSPTTSPTSFARASSTGCPTWSEAARTRARRSARGTRRASSPFNAQVERMFRDYAPKAIELYGVKTDEDAQECTRDLMADGASYGTHLWAQAHLEHGLDPVYLYLFDRRIPDKDGFGSWEAAYHSGDLWYVHGTIGRSWRGMGPDDYKTSNLMMDYWTNFAKTGNPNCEGLPLWSPYVKGAPGTMVINEKAGMSNLEDNPGVKILD